MGSPDGVTDDVVRGKAETSRKKKKKKKNEILTYINTKKGCVTSHFCIMQNCLYTYKEIVTISKNG